MARVALPQSKLRARRRRRRILLIAGLVFALLLLIGGAVALSWAPFVRIQTIEISGVSSVSAENVESAVRQELGGAYLYVFAKDNILFYPKLQIQSALRKEFPVFGSVGLAIKDFKILTVNVVEQVPVALWCGASSASSSPCFLLDESGVVYAPAADFSGQVYAK